MIEAAFHIHSKYLQDSFLSPRLIIRTAKRKGLSAIAVTDHDTIMGALETVQDASAMSDLLVVPGIEVKKDVGDIIGFFVGEDIASRGLSNNRFFLLSNNTMFEGYNRPCRLSVSATGVVGTDGHRQRALEKDVSSVS